MESLVVAAVFIGALALLYRWLVVMARRTNPDFRFWTPAMRWVLGIGAAGFGALIAVQALLAAGSPG